MQYSLTPQIAFHGTQIKSLPSIGWCLIAAYLANCSPFILHTVQHGLVIPGANNNPIKVRCGSSLGKGIYVSPSAEFSLGYVYIFLRIKNVYHVTTSSVTNLLSGPLLSTPPKC